MKPMRRDKDARFIGHWAPTILILDLNNKIVNPCSAHLLQTFESKRLAKSRFFAFGWVN